ncbi:mitochondrial 54S ribosomal protein YmL35 [Sparganum proliferum]
MFIHIGSFLQVLLSVEACRWFGGTNQCPIDGVQLNLDHVAKHLLMQTPHTYVTKISYFDFTMNVDMTVKTSRSRVSGFHGEPVVECNRPFGPEILAKWMFGRLKFLAEVSPTTVTSAYQFFERIKHLKLEPDESIVSFDVVSLFTSIPQQLAIDVVDQLLAERYEERDKPLKSEHLLELLRYCLKTYFTFGGQMYEQIKGTPMGSPISGLIAEVVLQRVEHLVFTKYQPKFWARYVDDTFAVVKTTDIEHLKELLNSVNPDIQFTMEAETNNQLPFLDILVRRCTTGQLQTTVFRKSTSTRQILHFNSNHPLSHKRSCVRTLFQRVETHCSTPEDKRAERLYLVNPFTANGYPRHFIERSRRWAPRRRPNEQQPEVWRAIPYVKGVSEAVALLLQPTRVGIAHRPQATIRRRLMQPKDPLPPAETSAVIYKINCNEGDCNYVGETGRKLQTRLQEHKSATRRANGYPRTFVERSRKQSRKRNEGPSQPKSWRSITYMKGVSEAVARSIAPLGIGVAHRPDSTIRRQVMRPKDPIPKQEMSAIVYRLQCSCGMCNYVGETGRRLQTRMHVQKLAVRRLDPKSEVATHAAQMRHVFDVDAVEIVGRGDDHTARQVQEAWMSTDSSVNRHINLPPPYLVLRTFLTEDSHGAGQSGPPIIAAADEDEQDSGHGSLHMLRQLFNLFSPKLPKLGIGAAVSTTPVATLSSLRLLPIVPTRFVLNPLGVAPSRGIKSKEVKRYWTEDGTHDPPLQDAVDRFKKLRWGAYIHARAGRRKHLYRKNPWVVAKKDEHILTNRATSFLVDNLMSRYWRRPQFYPEDIYEPYHKRTGVPWDYELHKRRFYP